VPPETPHAELVEELRARRVELDRELTRLTRPPEPGASIGFGKRIGEGTTEAIERLSTTAAARSISTSLADVDRALEKVDAGTYGACDDCGDTIPAERLEARPTTAVCVRCSEAR
jgi:DnaK suppressor protein